MIMQLEARFSESACSCSAQLPVSLIADSKVGFVWPRIHERVRHMWTTLFKAGKAGPLARQLHLFEGTAMVLANSTAGIPWIKQP